MPTQGLMWKLQSLVQESEKAEVKGAAIATSKLFYEYKSTMDYAAVKDHPENSKIISFGLMHLPVGVLTNAFNIDIVHRVLWASIYKSLNIARWESPFKDYLDNSEKKKNGSMAKTEAKPITIESIKKGVYEAVTEQMPDFSSANEKDSFLLFKGEISMAGDDNSMDFIELIMDVEERFNIEITDEEAESTNSVAKLLKLVESKRKELEVFNTEHNDTSP